MILPACGNPQKLPVGGGSRTKGPIWPGKRVAMAEGNQEEERRALKGSGLSRHYASAVTHIHGVMGALRNENAMKTKFLNSILALMFNHGEAVKQRLA